MPSFRASVAITALLPGREPAAALIAAQEGVSRLAHPEDWFVDVESLPRGGLPRLTVRFTVPWSNDAAEDAAAWAAAKAMATAVGAVANWRDLRAFRRTKGRWLPLEQ